jgi:hypothetical protein
MDQETVDQESFTAAGFDKRHNGSGDTIMVNVQTLRGLFEYVPKVLQLLMCPDFWSISFKIKGTLFHNMVDMGLGS